MMNVIASTDTATLVEDHRRDSVIWYVYSIDGHSTFEDFGMAQAYFNVKAAQ